MIGDKRREEGSRREKRGQGETDAQQGIERGGHEREEKRYRGEQCNK